METSVVIPMWQLIVYTVFFASSYAVIAYMTRRNTVEIKDMDKKYVSSELYHSEVKHINETLGEIKIQNSQIIVMLQQNKENK